MKSHEEELMELDFIHLAQFLTRLPEREGYEHKLFRSIEAIQMSIDKKRFDQVLASKKDQAGVTWWCRQIRSGFNLTKFR